MGAFGRLLIKSWGGNLDNYDGNSNKEVALKLAKTNKKRESELWMYRMNNTIYPIRDKVVYGILKLEDITKEHFNFCGSQKDDCWKYFLIWKKERMKNGYLN